MNKLLYDKVFTYRYIAVKHFLKSLMETYILKDVHIWIWSILSDGIYSLGVS